MEMIGEKVPSRIDWWMHATVWLVTVVMVGLFVMMFGDTEVSLFFNGVFAVIIFATILFLFSIYLATYYVLEDEYIFIRSGPLKKIIRYESIKSVKLSRNALSSMALSSNRIEIREYDKSYMKGTTLISPVNREEFFVELKRYCKNLER